MKKDGISDKLIAGFGGLNAVNLALGSAEAFTKALNELYTATTTEGIPDDLLRLVERLK